MWIVTNKGFLSVVANRDKADHFLIRARNIEAFDGYFPTKSIVSMSDSDYRFRVFVSRKELMDFQIFLTDQITYPNFKSSIKDAGVKTMASKIWTVSFEFQEKLYGKQNYGWVDYRQNTPTYTGSRYSGDIDQYGDIIDEDYLDDEFADSEVEFLDFDRPLGDEEMGEFEALYGMSLDDYLDQK